MIASLDANEELRRREFPICARKIYLAHAADAPLPRRVADAMQQSIDDAARHEKQYDQSLAFIAKTRALAASFLGAKLEEVSLSGSTSTSLSMIASGLSWNAGDEVVCYLDEYPANVYPWLALERQGVKIIWLQPLRIGEIRRDLIQRALTRRTRLLALASANYCSGFRIDLDEIGTLCRQHGVLFSVDAIQTLGAFPINTATSDFISAGAQKWMLGPSGAGILFVKESRRDLLWPPMIGGWNVKSANFIAQNEIEFAAGGQKFEPGAYSTACLAGLAAALELLTEVGQEEITDRILQLTRFLREALAADGFEFLSPTEERNRSGIVTTRHPATPTEQLAKHLAENDVIVSVRTDRAGNRWLRISPHFYNTIAEMERVTKLLRTAA